MAYVCPDGARFVCKASMQIHRKVQVSRNQSFLRSIRAQLSWHFPFFRLRNTCRLPTANTWSETREPGISFTTDGRLPICQCHMFQSWSWAMHFVDWKLNMDLHNGSSVRISEWSQRFLQKSCDLELLCFMVLTRLQRTSDGFATYPVSPVVISVLWAVHVDCHVHVGPGWVTQGQSGNGKPQSDCGLCRHQSIGYEHSKG